MVLARASGHNHPDPRWDVLYTRLFDWWLRLSKGQIILVYKDGSYHFYLKNRNQKNWKERWKKLKKDSQIKAILFSSISNDNLTFFVNYFLSLPEKEIKSLMKIKDLPSYLIKNYKKFFKKYKIFTIKDYTLKHKE